MSDKRSCVEPESCGLSIARQCESLGLPRSTYYYRSQPSDEHELRAALQRLAGQWPRYGSRRLAAQLQREGFQVNRKHVQRLMRELGVQGHTSAKKRRTTNSEHSFPRYANLVEQLFPGVILKESLQVFFFGQLPQTLHLQVK